MDLPTVGNTLMASGVLPTAYVLGSLILLAGVFTFLSGPRPRSPTRRAAGAILGAFGLALALPALVLGIAATSSPAPTPSPTVRLGDDLISCATNGELPPVPVAPPPGCVLVIEWGDPGLPPTSLLATTGPVEAGPGQHGRWWYHSPAAADQHLRAFHARYPGLPIEDLR